MSVDPVPNGFVKNNGENGQGSLFETKKRKVQIDKIKVPGPSPQKKKKKKKNRRGKSKPAAGTRELLQQLYESLAVEVEELNQLNIPHVRVLIAAGGQGLDLGLNFVEKVREVGRGDVEYDMSCRLLDFRGQLSCID